MAAGLKTFAVCPRTMYLLNTPTIDVTATTYHAECELRIIATMRPVRSAPLGNAHRFFVRYRMSASITIAGTVATPTDITTGHPSRAPARTARKPSTTRTSPFGVRKKRLARMCVVWHRAAYNLAH